MLCAVDDGHIYGAAKVQVRWWREGGAASIRLEEVSEASAPPHHRLEFHLSESSRRDDGMEAMERSLLFLDLLCVPSRPRKI